MQEFFINSDGIEIHAKLEMPKGEPKSCPLCIVQHGLTGHMEENHIVAVAAALREVGVATLRVEMYGHGKSGGSFGKHTLLKWINNMLDVVDYAKGLDFVTELYLCGHSQGGLLAMLVAALRKDDLAAIMPLSPAVVIVDAAREGAMFGMHFDPTHIPDRIYMESPKLAEDGTQASYFCGDYFRIAQHIHVDEAIAAYHGPVLLVHGTADAAVPVRYSIEASEAYENARLVLLEGDDHGYHRHLDQACEAVRQFVTSLPGKR
ncbi:MAG: alpha/beta fold hydrolase [Atopobiaceae bacterium]|nr:alpha/beta fold hydrolase [Atopobiaceae bacterium]